MWFVLAEAAWVALLLLLCLLVSPTLVDFGVVLLLFLAWLFYTGHKDNVAARRRKDEHRRAQEAKSQRRSDEIEREFAEEKAPCDSPP